MSNPVNKEDDPPKEHQFHEHHHDLSDPQWGNGVGPQPLPCFSPVPTVAVGAGPGAPEVAAAAVDVRLVFEERLDLDRRRPFPPSGQDLVLGAAGLDEVTPFERSLPNLAIPPHALPYA